MYYFVIFLTRITIPHIIRISITSNNISLPPRLIVASKIDSGRKIFTSFSILNLSTVKLLRLLSNT